LSGFEVSAGCQYDRRDCEINGAATLGCRAAGLTQVSALHAHMRNVKLEVILEICSNGIQKSAIIKDASNRQWDSSFGILLSMPAKVSANGYRPIIRPKNPRTSVPKKQIRDAARKAWERALPG
jgi:hypothetical protein